MNPDLHYLTCKEYAAKLGVSMDRVWQFCVSGRIPGAVLLANRWFIPSDAEVTRARPDRESFRHERKRP